MAHGVWLNDSALTKLTDIETNLSLEILSRSIDALWKTPPSNKIWILYVELMDDLSTPSACLADTSGPQDSKYFADDGVYYAYNFVEE